MTSARMSWLVGMSGELSRGAAGFARQGAQPGSQGQRFNRAACRIRALQTTPSALPTSPQLADEKTRDKLARLLTAGPALPRRLSTHSAFTRSAHPLQLADEKALDMSHVRHFVVDECDKCLENIDMRADVQVRGGVVVVGVGSRGNHAGHTAALFSSVPDVWLPPMRCHSSCCGWVVLRG